VSGIVADSSTHEPLSPVSIENMRTHDGCFSNAKGEFTIQASLGDYLVFSHVGYTKRVFILKVMDNLKDLKIYMTLKTTKLKPVTIKRGLTKYQKDSINRAQIYQDAIEYRQQKSVFSPITSIYQKFSKKYKNIRKFQDQIELNEKQKFIDTRYTPELVATLTPLKDDELAAFMNEYPMEFEYARAATELEIKMWIKFNYQDFVSKGKPPFNPANKKKS
jgi:hypothetical protein